MLSLQNIRFKYPKKEDFALVDISFSIQPGEIFSLLGPNGAGKTTIIRILSGLILPQQGVASVCGFDLRQREYNARRSIGLVIGDERTFYFRLSGAQNLEFFGGLYGIKRNTLKKKVPEVLRKVGLERDADLQYMRYSTGMRKRLNMARALLHDPDALLLDEPNSGVDPHSAKSIREIILSLRNDNKTILLTTHDMEEAERMSDRIGFLRDGKLIKVGFVDEYKNIMSNRVLEITFVHPPDLGDAHSIGKLLTDIKNESDCDKIELDSNVMRVTYSGAFEMNRALNIILKCGFEISRTNTIESSLEDVFIKLAG